MADVRENAPLPLDLEGFFGGTAEDIMEVQPGPFHRRIRVYPQRTPVTEDTPELCHDLDKYLLARASCLVEAVVFRNPKTTPPEHMYHLRARGKLIWVESALEWAIADGPGWVFLNLWMLYGHEGRLIVIPTQPLTDTLDDLEARAQHLKTVLEAAKKHDEEAES